MAGLTELPAVLVEADDATAARYALVENLQREDLNPIEEAGAYQALIERYGLTQEQIAAEVGLSRSAVTNALRLLGLPEEVNNLLLSGQITAGHARALLGLRDKSLIVPAALNCVEKDLSVRRLEEYVASANRKQASRELPPKGPRPEAEYIRSIEGRFRGKTGRRCRIQYTGKQRAIQIEFRDNADLEAICRLLAGEDFFEDF